MATLHFSTLLPNLCQKQPVWSDKKGEIKTTALYSSKLSGADLEHYGPSKNSKFGPVYCHSARCNSLGSVPFAASTFTNQTDGTIDSPTAENCDELQQNRVDILVRVLHESARSFSIDVESLKLAGSGAELSSAWLGKDVHEWHKLIGHQVAIYALLKTAIEVEYLLSRERTNSPLPVQAIISKRLDQVEEHIEGQLHSRHEDLVNWFKTVELPRIAGFFIPLLKKWSMEYAGSGVAGIIVAISCCAAVGKLGPRQSSSSLRSLCNEDALVELMDLSHTLVSVDKLHNLATEAGFEVDFLTHFGAKVLPSKNSEELEFWIGLAKNKLSVAFQEEPAISSMAMFQDEVKRDSLAVLGLFAYLGRSTRLYLAKAGMIDVDELIRDFLSYLECGIVFIYPEFSSISVYQLYMEIIIDEIGWLDLYHSRSSVSSQKRKRSKRLKQAEKEIILSSVFTVCYDVFSGFAHFTRSTLQPLDGELLDFLLRSQNLLSTCLEDYWAAYDRSCEPLKAATETIATERRSSVKLSPALEAQQSNVLIAQEYLKNKSSQLHQEIEPMDSDEVDKITSIKGLRGMDPRTMLLQQNFLKKYCVNFVSTSSNLWIGTQVLLVDLMLSMDLLLKQLRGHKVSKREKKLLSRTLQDIVALVPVTILMLLPVTLPGHAAILAAIKRYVPTMIPSPYTRERLGMIKQLKRTQKLEVHMWSNLREDPSTSILSE